MANPKITLSAGISPIEGAIGTYLITLDTPAPAGGLTVYYNSTGSTATFNDDYNFVAGESLTAVTDNSFTIAAGTTTATLNLVAHTDGVVEPKENVVVNLTAGTDYDLTSTTVQFAKQTSVVAVGSQPLSIITADFNNDGNADLATTNSSAHTVSVRLGNGKGGFTGNTTVAVGTSPLSMTTADFNNDGNADLAIANFGDDTVSVRLGNGKGDFPGKTNIAMGSHPYSITTADFNHDGNADLATGKFTETNAVSVRLGDGKGGFTSKTNVEVGSLGDSITTADFNNDGNMDFSTAHPYGYGNDSTVSVHLGDGKGGFIGNTTVAVGDNPNSVTVADFNNDGNADLAIASDNTISVDLGDGKGGFTDKTTIAVRKYPLSIITADFNNDGKLDLATSSAGSESSIVDTVSVRLGDGKGWFTDETTIAVSQVASSITTADFNNDGKLDLAVTDQLSNNVLILLNTSKTTTAKLTITDIVPPCWRRLKIDHLEGFVPIEF